jgi:hypothetical protein
MILERIILTTASTAPAKAPELSIDWNALAFGLRVIKSGMSSDNKEAALRIIVDNFRDKTWGTYTSGVIDILLKILGRIDESGDKLPPHAAARLVVSDMRASMKDVLREAFLATTDEGYHRELIPNPGQHKLGSFLTRELGFVVADAKYHFDEEPSRVLVGQLA